MNRHLPRLFATRAAFLLASLCFAGSALAAPAGTVTQLSGLLFAQKADGRAKVLASGSSVDVGDTLITGPAAYAEMRLADRSVVTLQPDTRLAIEAFSFDATRMQDDRAELNLIEGGIRIASGGLGNYAGRYTLKTTFGTIEVGKSTFIAQYGAPAAAAVASGYRIHLASLSSSMLSGGTMSDASPAPLVIAQNAPVLPGAPKPTVAPGLPAGLYVSVIDGSINLSNKGGSQSFTAGQFGYTANVTKPPVVVPANPGIKFTPPPTFSSNSGSGGNKAAAVDCVVR